MKDFLAVSIAAIAGANLRHILSRLATQFQHHGFPFGTLFINIAGSFIAGFFLAWTSERAIVDSRWRLLVVVGFCGSFTTFSGYAFETMSYFEQGRWAMAGANILGNNVLCLAAVLGGIGLARVV